jgi:hypothetical protein
LERCSRRYANPGPRTSEVVTYTNITQAERDPEEEGDFMAFEQLMAEAAAKKDSKDKDKHHHHHDKKEKKKEKEKA